MYTALGKEESCQEIHTALVASRVLYDSQDTHWSAVFSVHTSISGVLSVILVFLIIWLEEIFCNTRTAENFGDQDISKYLNNLFVVIEQTNRISLATFSDLQCHAHDQSCCW